MTDEQTATQQDLDAKRVESRAAMLELLTTGTDKQFDELACIVSLGIEIERVLDGITDATKLSAIIGHGAEVIAMCEIEHGGRHYHAQISACPGCDARAAGTGPASTDKES